MNHCFVFSQKLFLSHYRNNLLWLHTVFAVLYLILTIILLRRHTSQMKGMPRETVSHHLPKDFDHSTNSLEIFQIIWRRSLFLHLTNLSSCLQTRNTLFVCSVPKAATEEDIKTHFK